MVLWPLFGYHSRRFSRHWLRARIDSNDDTVPRIGICGTYGDDNNNDGPV